MIHLPFYQIVNKYLKIIDIILTMDFNFLSNNTSSTEDLNTNITIRVQQRNGRKSWTIIEGLDKIVNIDMKSLLKLIKKKLCCNGAIKSNKDLETIIQCQGDHRYKLKDLIMSKYKIQEHCIHIHGF